MENTRRWWAIVAAFGLTFAFAPGAVRAETDDKTIDLSASDKKVQVWHKSADGTENLIDISQSALDAHLAHGDRISAPSTSTSLLSGPLGAPVLGEHDAAGAAGGTASVTSTDATTGSTGAAPATTAPASSPAASLPGFGWTPLGGPIWGPVLGEHDAAGAAGTPVTTSTTSTAWTTSTTATPATTGTTATPATTETTGAAPASAPAAALPGSDVSPLGAPLAGSHTAAIDVSRAFIGLVNTVPSTVDVRTFRLTDVSATLDSSQIDSVTQQISASPGAAQNQAALEDALRKENLLTADQKVIGVVADTREILFRRTDSTLPAGK